MEELLKETAKQIPALTLFSAVLCYLVRMFLNTMRERDETIIELHKEHMDARAHTRDALKENSQRLQENTVAIARFSDAIYTCPLREDKK